MIHHYTISVLCVSYGNGITDHPMSSFISSSVCSCHNSIHFRCAPACLLVINIIVFVGVESSRIRQGNGSSRSTSQTVHTNNSILLANCKLCCVVGVMLQQQKQEPKSRQEQVQLVRSLAVQWLCLYHALLPPPILHQQAKQRHKHTKGGTYRW